MNIRTDLKRQALNTVPFLVAVSLVLVANDPCSQALRTMGAENVPSATQSQDTPLDILAKRVQRLEEQQDEQSKQIKGVVRHLVSSAESQLDISNYQQARRQFEAKLIRHAPSPQNAASPVVPDDAREIDYQSGELRLHAWVSKSEGKEKRPAVLYLHGGFAMSAEDWKQTQPFRDAGYVVLTPMLRGENSQKGDFSYFYHEVDDAVAAAELLASQPNVDANRIFVAGHSVGGTLSLLTAMASGRFRAAVSLSAAPDQVTVCETHSPSFVPFDKNDVREAQIRSPLEFAGSFQCPVRILYGEAEVEVDLMSQRLAWLARKSGVDCEAVRIPGDHMSSVRGGIQQALAFFARQSLGEASLPLSVSKAATLPKVLDLDLGESVTLRLVRLEPGTFLMGSPESEPGRRMDESQHEVTINHPVCMGVFPITQAQYLRVMGTAPSAFAPNGRGKDRVAGMSTAEFPVDSVSWEDAMDFCRVISLLPVVRENGWTVDLPTEAEWEFACRAGSTSPLNYGSVESNQQANFNGEQLTGGTFLKRTSRVGSYPPNSWGLYDMHGNVLQWCSDGYTADYSWPERRNDQSTTVIATQRVSRGGSWLATAAGCRSAYRDPEEPTAQFPNRGFRVVVRQGIPVPSR